MMEFITYFEHQKKSRDFLKYRFHTYSAFAYIRSLRKFSYQTAYFVMYQTGYYCQLFYNTKIVVYIDHNLRHKFLHCGSVTVLLFP